MNEDEIDIVVDNGSGFCRAGFAGDDAPRTVFPAKVARSYDESMMRVLRESYVGIEAQAKRGILSVKYPIKRGIVKDWGAMEDIWTHMFHNELRVMPEECGVLVTEAPQNPKSHRENMMQIMLETFRVSRFQVALQSVLSLYSAGRVSGMVLGSGEGVTYVMPIYEGYALEHANKRSHLAGVDLTDYLAKVLRDRFPQTKMVSREVVQNMKERLCYAASDFVKESASFDANTDQGYELPDGRVISVGVERFKLAEGLFHPVLIGSNEDGIHDMIHDSMSRCAIDVRRDLYKNIVLSGGTTMIPGLAERLCAELTNTAPPLAQVRIVASPERKFSAWIGGSILGSLSSFRHMWIDKRRYEEYGMSVIHRRRY